MSEKKEAASEGKTKKTRVEKREVTRKFWFHLTDAEKVQLTDMALKLEREAEEETTQLNEETKERRAAIKQKVLESKKLKTIYHDGKEIREVAALEVLDYGKKEVRYLVGKEVKESRPMTDDELQISMNLEVREKERAEAEADGTKTTTEQKLRAEAEAFQKKKASKKKPVSEIDQVIREETSKLTKKSAVDGPAETQLAEAH
jgi:hypothetical protein